MQNVQSSMPNAQSSLPTRVLYYGKDEPLPERVPLRAGLLTMIYEAGDLRYIKLGGREVIRRIYAAVRDRNWGTVPSQMSDVRFQISDGSFRIGYVSTHQQNEIHFVWRGEIIGEPDGTIRFTFNGEARSTFLKNRIGLCVLHPIRECVGAPCQVEHVDGSRETVTFPKLIAAEQLVKGLQDLRAIASEITPRVWAEVHFEGDIFETEDQRNWIDASFKTFSTPLRIPYPVEIAAGRKLMQSVTLRLVDERGGHLDLGRTGYQPVPSGDSPDGMARASSANVGLRSAPMPTVVPVRESPTGAGESPAPPILQDVQRVQTAPSPVEIWIDPDLAGRPIPSIGLLSPGDEDRRLRPKRMHKRLKALALSHVRVDLKLSACDWVAELFGTLEWAERLNLGLEIALHLGKSAKKDIPEFLEYPPLRRVKIARFLIFETKATSTSAALLEIARRRLKAFRPGTPIGSGTTADFYQLNQFRPPAHLCDCICWSMNPQVHAVDNTSLVENAAGIPPQIESARAYFHGKPLVVSPVLLKPGFNPVAKRNQRTPPPVELPPEVDPRQMSLFGAAWTLAAFKSLAEAGADSVTFYETIGWRGVMETERGSTLPEKFRSIPAAVFPLYHVLADVGEFAGGEVIVSRSSDPLKVEALALRAGNSRSVFLANMTAQPQPVSLQTGSEKVRMRKLDETNAEFAMREPETFRKERAKPMRTANGHVEADLRPYGILRIDLIE